MSATVAMARFHDVSPRTMARMAGGIYVFRLLTAVTFELLLGGRLGYAANFIQMLGMAAVTLFCYLLFKGVSRGLALLAATFNLAGLIFEVLRLSPQGINLALGFHGVFCVLIGYLIVRSTFLPRVLGGLIALGGFSWLTFALPALAAHLAPWNTIVGLAGEASVFLWLLAMGVNAERWREQARA